MPKEIKKTIEKRKPFFELIKARKVGCSDHNYVSLEDQKSDDKSFLAGDDPFISVGDDFL